MTHFYTSWKCQKTKGFLTFSRGIEMWHWTKMGEETHDISLIFVKPNIHLEEVHFTLQEKFLTILEQLNFFKSLSIDIWLEILILSEFSIMYFNYWIPYLIIQFMKWSPQDDISKEVCLKKSCTLIDFRIVFWFSVSSRELSHDIRYNLMAIVPEQRISYQKKMDILIHNKWVKWVSSAFKKHVYPFYVLGLILYPFKKLENQSFGHVLKGYRKTSGTK